MVCTDSAYRHQEAVPGVMLASVSVHECNIPAHIYPIEIWYF